MGNQDQVSVETPLSVGVCQNQFVAGGTGTYITTTITKRKGMLVVSYDTSGGLTQWHVYLWDDIGLAWVDITNPPHVHMDNSTGGEAHLIMVNNSGHVWFNDLYPKKANWMGQAVSGTGAAITENPTGTNSEINLATGTTTTGYAEIYQGGASIDFADYMRWLSVFKFTTSPWNNVLVRFGCGVEGINAATDNTNKLGIEWCDSQATANFYTLSANGSSRSLVDSGVAFTAGSSQGIRMIYFPASKAQYKFSNGTIYDKTGVLPAGVATWSRQFTYGVKNNNGGSANRDLQARSTFLVGQANNSAFVGTG